MAGNPVATAEINVVLNTQGVPAQAANIARQVEQQLTQGIGNIQVGSQLSNAFKLDPILKDGSSATRMFYSEIGQGAIKAGEEAGQKLSEGLERSGTAGFGRFNRLARFYGSQAAGQFDAGIASKAMSFGALSLGLSGFGVLAAAGMAMAAAKASEAWKKGLKPIEESYKIQSKAFDSGKVSSDLQGLRRELGLNAEDTAKMALEAANSGVAYDKLAESVRKTAIATKAVDIDSIGGQMGRTSQIIGTMMENVGNSDAAVAGLKTFNSALEETIGLLGKSAQGWQALGGKTVEGGQWGYGKVESGLETYLHAAGGLLGDDFLKNIDLSPITDKTAAALDAGASESKIGDMVGDSVYESLKGKISQAVLDYAKLSGKSANEALADISGNTYIGQTAKPGQAITDTGEGLATASYFVANPNKSTESYPSGTTITTLGDIDGYRIQRIQEATGPAYFEISGNGIKTKVGSLTEAQSKIEALSTHRVKEEFKSVSQPNLAPITLSGGGGSTTAPWYHPSEAEKKFYKVGESKPQQVATTYAEEFQKVAKPSIGTIFVDAAKGAETEIKEVGKYIGTALDDGFREETRDKIFASIKTLENVKIQMPLEQWKGSEAEGVLNTLYKMHDTINKIAQVTKDKAELNIDASNADAELTALYSDLNKFGNTIATAKVDADVDPAISNINKVLDALEKVKQGAKAKIEIDDHSVFDPTKSARYNAQQALKDWQSDWEKGLAPNSADIDAILKNSSKYTNPSDKTLMNLLKQYQAGSIGWESVGSYLGLGNGSFGATGTGPTMGAAPAYQQRYSNAYPTAATYQPSAPRALAASGYPTAFIQTPTMQLIPVVTVAGGMQAPIVRSAPAAAAANGSYLDYPGISGLLPYKEMPPRGSMQWLTSYKDMEEGPYKYNITAGPSIKGGSRMTAPDIITSGTPPVAWLSEGQPTGMDMINNQLRQLQIDMVLRGPTVKTWDTVAPRRGPEWFSKALEGVSPGITGREPGITMKGDEKFYNQFKAATTPTQKTLSQSAWSMIYDNSGTCIAYVEPDPSLKFTPGKQYSQALDRASWNAVYDNSGTCVAYVEPDPSLKFTPGKGYSAGFGGGITSSQQQALSLQGNGAGSGASIWGFDQTTGEAMKYDPRNDTCEGLGFLAAPYLKTTDQFYLGMTTGAEQNISKMAPEEGGWGGITSQLAAQRAPIQYAATALKPDNEVREALIDTRKILADNTATWKGMGQSLGKIQSKDWNPQMTFDFGSAGSYSMPMNPMGGASGGGTPFGTGGGLWTGAGGGGGGFFSPGISHGPGYFFGGTSISGGGYWVGGNTAQGWGASEPGWWTTEYAAVGGDMGGAAPAPSGGGGGGWGGFAADAGNAFAIQYAEGTDYVPYTGLFKLHQGEMVIPRAESDQLRKGMGGGVNLHYAPVINGSGLSPDQLLAVMDANSRHIIEQAKSEINMDSVRAQAR